MRRGGGGKGNLSELDMSHENSLAVGTSQNFQGDDLGGSPDHLQMPSEAPA